MNARSPLAIVDYKPRLKLASVRSEKGQPVKTAPLLSRYDALRRAEAVETGTGGISQGANPA